MNHLTLPFTWTGEPPSPRFLEALDEVCMPIESASPGDPVAIRYVGASLRDLNSLSGPSFVVKKGLHRYDIVTWNDLSLEVQRRIAFGVVELKNCTCPADQLWTSAVSSIQSGEYGDFEIITGPQASSILDRARQAGMGDKTFNTWSQEDLSRIIVSVGWLPQREGHGAIEAAMALNDFHRLLIDLLLPEQFDIASPVVPLSARPTSRR